jgi:hypothetical protein
MITGCGLVRPASQTRLTDIGPHIYGSQLVVSTDVGPGGPTLLTYRDADGTDKPLAGTLSVSVCVAKGK